MRVLDLFAGAGGWDEAIDAAVDRLELDPYANATATAAGHHTLTVRNVWAPIHRRYDGIVASPPCQPFTNANRDRRDESLERVTAALDAGAAHSLSALMRWALRLDDRRTGLALVPVAHVAAIRPTWVAFEQVPEVLPLWEAIARLLRRNQYHAWTGILHTEQYGIPQTRSRAILTAHRHRPVRQPPITHSRYHRHTPDQIDPGLTRWVSLADALGWGDDGKVYSNYGNSGGGDRGVRPTSAPSFAITSKTNRNKVTWPGDGPGSIGVAEAGVLQGFRADYPWCGPKNQRHQQIGNAVPPPLARAIIATLEE